VFLVVSDWTWAQDVVEDLLGALSAAPGAALLTTPKAHLYINDKTPTPADVPGDYTEATFTGYAADALGTLLGPVNLLTNVVGMHCEVDFLAGVVTPPGELCIGVYLTDTTGAIYYGGWRFPDPVNFAQAGDALSLDIVLPLPLVQQAQ